MTPTRLWYAHRMPDESLTVSILREIRDQIATTNTRREAHIVAQNETNARLETAHATLARRLVESEVRLGTEFVAVAVALGDVKTLLRERLDDRDRITDIDRRVTVLEKASSRRARR